MRSTAEIEDQNEWQFMHHVGAYAPPTESEVRAAANTSLAAVLNAISAVTMTALTTQAQMEAQAQQAAQPRDCGFLGVGCFDAGAALNNVASAASGAVDFAVNHPGTVFLAATAATIGGVCIVASGGVCAAVIAGAAIGGGLGGGVYTGTHLSSWDPNDALTETTMGSLFGALGGGVGAYWSSEIISVGSAQATRFAGSLADSAAAIPDWLPGGTRVASLLTGPITDTGTSLITGAARVVAAGSRVAAAVGADYADSATAVAMGRANPTAAAAAPLCDVVAGFTPTAAAACANLVRGLPIP